ncbi:hypothetical protein Trco_008455 [Trichoderma cornu-damae]|uniref:Uncharacterized protein n=1 Tax=Trichoderma cornu-damae TaxID=654480 RepID=A0A9P8QE25_9HYPO|nr:hypothetical protein Trco_008455 [Trichoderma cornu-damae]
MPLCSRVGTLQSWPVVWRCLRLPVDPRPSAQWEAVAMARSGQVRSPKSQKFGGWKVEQYFELK